MEIETQCLYAGYSPKNGEPQTLPICQSTTFKYESTEQVSKLFDLEEAGFFYTRLGNPTVDAVEQKIAMLEGGVGALCTASGQAATTFSILTLAAAGDHIVSSSAIYGGSLNLFAVTLKRLGIEVTFVSPEASEDEIQAAFRPNTKALFGETIANPALTVLDIDPAYTLGDMIRKRMEIIRQLKEEGVFTLNKELPLPTLPKRIAVITSLTAAGYEDFLNQLANNKAGYPFYPKLFPALMQGERTEESVIAALDRVYRHADCFDVVVIIRGGGATSDLNSFDSYLLAANCAQFPLPIITGIGHERDDTILDMVAHTRMKTPTAVAEFLIGQMDKAAGEVEELQQDVCSLATEILSRQKNFLQSLGSRLPVLAINRIERNRSLLQRIGMQLPTDAHAFLNQWASKLEAMQVRLANRAESSLAERSRFVQLTEQFIKMASPDYVLKRGYSLTLKDGKIIKQADGLVVGDELITRFADGEVRSKVLKK